MREVFGSERFLDERGFQIRDVWVRTVLVYLPCFILTTHPKTTSVDFSMIRTFVLSPVLSISFSIILL